jgi:hypothetical protein
MAWEIVQLPLYTIYWTEDFGTQVFALLHCTIGDRIIAGLALFAASVIADQALQRGSPSDGRLVPSIGCRLEHGHLESRFASFGRSCLDRGSCAEATGLT